MTLADAITPHLPYLRRYARAMTGSQEIGDSYVEASLQAVAGDPQLIRDVSNPRASLYRVLAGIWNANGPSIDSGRLRQGGAERRLETMTPRPRQAFLLIFMEGFSIDEAAMVLDTDIAEVQDLIAQADRELTALVASEVLIIEDEPIIALDLQAIVEELGHSVLGVARTHAEAVSMVRARKPGLVFADIQLADGSSGIDAVNEMLGAFEVPVVFITAFPERLLTGERPEPAFLITKPFSATSVRAAAGQALFFEQNAHAGQTAGNGQHQGKAVA